MKQKAPREASGEVPAQLRVSREDKGKIHLNLNGIPDVSREAKLVSLSSPNSEALAPSANLTFTSGVKAASLNTDGVANTVLISKSTTKIPSRKAEALYSAKYFSREAGSKVLCSTSYLRRKAENKAPLYANDDFAPKIF